MTSPGSQRFTHNSFPQALLAETQCVLRNKKALNPILIGKKFAMNQSREGKASQRKRASKPRA